MPRGNQQRTSYRTPVPPRKKNWLLRFILISLLLLTTTGALSYFYWNLRTEHQDVTARSADCTTELSTVKYTVERLTKKLESCTKFSTDQASVKKAQEKSLASLSEDLDATRAELTELRKQREETAKRLKAFQNLTEKFRKMIDSGKLDVVVRDGRMMLKLPSGVLFPSGSAELSTDGELTVMEVAIVLRDFPDRKFMITGHTDNRPLENAANKSKYASNWELSTARALTVTKFLIKARLSPTNLIAAGQAEFDPVGDNKTAPGRQSNRRIEISLLPKIDELPSIPTGT